MKQITHFYHVQHLRVQSDANPRTVEKGQTIQETGGWIWITDWVYRPWVHLQNDCLEIDGCLAELWPWLGLRLRCSTPITPAPLPGVLLPLDLIKPRVRLGLKMFPLGAHSVQAQGLQSHPRVPQAVLLEVSLLQEQT